MATDRWSIERRVHKGRTAFWFKDAGELSDLELVRNVITHDLGGKIIDSVPAVYATRDRIDVGDHTICLWHDGDRLWFHPEKDADKELTQAFALRLTNVLDAIPERQ